MKIIIPMTGYGSRFVTAGYRELKARSILQQHDRTDYFFLDSTFSPSPIFFRLVVNVASYCAIKCLDFAITLILGD
ncbi:MAG: hypothetical protein IJ849_10385 [Selenomonadaceae bacterium]|nr:hypothetical protein [Selenomonadaceae bacterium]